MEPTVTLPLSQYEKMQKDLEHLKKISDSRISVKSIKRSQGEIFWEYFIDKEHLPEVHKALADSLELYKKKCESLEQNGYDLQHQLVQARYEIERLEKLPKEGPSPTPEKKKSFWSL